MKDKNRKKENYFVRMRSAWKSKFAQSRWFVTACRRMIIHHHSKRVQNKQKQPILCIVVDPQREKKIIRFSVSYSVCSTFWTSAGVASILPLLSSYFFFPKPLFLTSYFFFAMGGIFVPSSIQFLHPSSLLPTSSFSNNIGKEELCFTLHLRQRLTTTTTSASSLRT